MSNKAILAKADIAVADLAANGGLLLPEQASAFLRKLLIQPTLLAQTRKVLMNSPQRNINKIGFGQRILRRGVQGQVLDNSTPARSRAKPTTEQIQLNTHEVIAEIRLPYDVIEDNIERGNIGQATDTGGTPVGGGIADTIMTLIAERAAIDLEELAIQGNTSSTDDYLSMVNGYLARATSHIVDLNDAEVSKSMFKQGVLALPVQYRRNLTALRHFVAPDVEIEYRDQLSNRETQMGDSHNGSGALPVYGTGVPVESVALMPGANGLLTHPMNLLFGIQRAIHVETDKDIRAREYIIVLTARVDFQIEEADAVVKYVEIGG